MLCLTLQHFYFLINLCSGLHTDTLTHTYNVLYTPWYINITPCYYQLLPLLTAAAAAAFCVCMHACVHLWVWMRLCEGASEEKGSCGMKLKAVDTVQLCRTPTTEERQSKSAKVRQWYNERKTGRWTSRKKTQTCQEKLTVRAHCITHPTLKCS